MAEVIGVPAYQQVADDLRRQISEGKIRVGQAIKSAAKLQQEYKVSSTVVQRAINELRAEGLLQGQPGKGVFVKATPDEAVTETLSLQRIAGEVVQLRTNLEEINAAPVAALRGEIDDMRRQLGRIEGNLVALYGRLGHPYPRDTERTENRQTPQRRARGA